MYKDNESTLTLNNVTFAGNSASDYGGRVRNDSRSSLTFNNVTFTGNLASYGGGMYNYFTSGPTISHATFTGNSASLGGAMYNYNASNPAIRNSVVWNNKDRNGSGATSQIYNEIVPQEPVTSQDLTVSYQYSDKDNHPASDPQFIF